MLKYNFKFVIKPMQFEETDKSIQTTGDEGNPRDEFESDVSRGEQERVEEKIRTEPAPEPKEVSDFRQEEAQFKQKFEQDKRAILATLDILRKKYKEEPIKEIDTKKFYEKLEDKLDEELVSLGEMKKQQMQEDYTYATEIMDNLENFTRKIETVRLEDRDRFAKLNSISEEIDTQVTIAYQKFNESQSLFNQYELIQTYLVVSESEYF